MSEEQKKHLREIIVEKARAARERGNIELAKWFMSLIFDEKRSPLA